MTIITIWHNNIGRPIKLWDAGVNRDGKAYDAQWYEARGGISPFDPDSETTVREFVRTIERYGAAILVDSRTIGPWNHHVAGIGAGHDDADWCESRFQEGSHAAWIENGESGHEDVWPREVEAIRILRRDAERQGTRSHAVRASAASSGTEESMTIMTTTRDSRVRAHIDTHTKTYWHANVTLSAPVPAADSPDGEDHWTSQRYYQCTHSHGSPDSARICAERIEHSFARFRRLPGYVRSTTP